MTGSYSATAHADPARGRAAHNTQTLTAETKDIPMHDSTLQQFIEKEFPFHVHLGVRADYLGRDAVRLYIPFAPQLIGHTGRPMIHGGVIASLVDICGGFAVWAHCKPEDHVATITLSVDYLRPANPADLYAEARIRLLGNKVGNAHVMVWTADNKDVNVAEGRGVYNIRRG
jgi:uncharacterized protein (TIGR00369 family)